MAWSYQANWNILAGTEQQAVHWDDLRKLIWSLQNYQEILTFDADDYADWAAIDNYSIGSVVKYAGEFYIANIDIIGNANNKPPRWRDITGQYDAGRWKLWAKPTEYYHTIPGVQRYRYYGSTSTGDGIAPAYYFYPQCTNRYHQVCGPLSGWAVDTVIYQDDTYNHNGGYYKSKSYHKATLQNEPGVGVNWTAYWIRSDTVYDKPTLLYRHPQAVEIKHGHITGFIGALYAPATSGAGIDVYPHGKNSNLLYPASRNGNTSMTDIKLGYGYQAHTEWLCCQFPDMVGNLPLNGTGSAYTELAPINGHWGGGANLPPLHEDQPEDGTDFYQCNMSLFEWALSQTGQYHWYLSLNPPKTDYEQDNLAIYGDDGVDNDGYLNTETGWKGCWRRTWAYTVNTKEELEGYGLLFLRPDGASRPIPDSCGRPNCSACANPDTRYRWYCVVAVQNLINSLSNQQLSAAHIAELDYNHNPEIHHQVVLSVKRVLEQIENFTEYMACYTYNREKEQTALSSPSPVANWGATTQVNAGDEWQNYRLIQARRDAYTSGTLGEKVQYGTELFECQLTHDELDGYTLSDAAAWTFIGNAASQSKFGWDGYVEAETVDVSDIQSTYYHEDMFNPGTYYRNNTRYSFIYWFTTSSAAVIKLLKSIPAFRIPVALTGDWGDKDWGNQDVYGDGGAKKHGNAVSGDLSVRSNFATIDHTINFLQYPVDYFDIDVDYGLPEGSPDPDYIRSQITVANTFFEDTTVWRTKFFELEPDSPAMSFYTWDLDPTYIGDSGYSSADCFASIFMNNSQQIIVPLEPFDLSLGTEIPTVNY